LPPECIGPQCLDESLMDCENSLDCDEGWFCQTGCCVPTEIP
jgi:hypothetical protein